MTESEFNTAMESVVANILYLRRELVEVTAAQLALMETICGLSQKTVGLEANLLKDRITALTEKYRQTCFEQIEKTAPALAAHLDARTIQQVSDGFPDE